MMGLFYSIRNRNAQVQVLDQVFVTGPLGDRGCGINLNESIYCFRKAHSDYEPIALPHWGTGKQKIEKKVTKLLTSTSQQLLGYC